MIDYGQKEDDICALLANDVYDVFPLPETEAEMARNFIKPTVFICCVGADFGSPENLGVLCQEETVTFEAIIRAKNRRGTAGIFAIVKDIFDKMMGYKFPGCDKIQLIRHGYIEGNPNNWNYVFSFSLNAKSVENQPEETAYLLKEPEFIEG